MRILRIVPLLMLLVAPAAEVRADEYAATIEVFRKAAESGEFFDNCYAYAVFPTVGKGGLGIGGAHGKGRVYVNGEHVGDTRMTPLRYIQWRFCSAEARPETRLVP